MLKISGFSTFTAVLVAVVYNIFVSDGARLPVKKTVPNNQFPWLVRFWVFPKEGGSRLCKGTLIQLDFILTSASCLKGHGLPNVTVVAGDHDLFEEEEQEQSIPSKEIISHERFNETGKLENDIAIIRLISKLQETDAVYPIPFLHAGLDSIDSGYVFTAGWGQLETPENLNGLAVLSSTPKKSQVFIQTPAN